MTASGAGSHNKHIVCREGVTLTLQDVDIFAFDGCALSFTGIGNQLNLTGSNLLQSGLSEPGIRVESGTALTIRGAGTVFATGGTSAAGIGGGYGRDGGSITVDGGTVDATGGNSGAGIGGGNEGIGGVITVSGGTVFATGGTSAAGIGGGDGG
ncbi:MAG: hypothetical protein PHQ85_10850, partial [Eubacteriales bacterium]|nr:hypothetical protein [Eubacteriales bacterium]